MEANHLIYHGIPALAEFTASNNQSTLSFTPVTKRASPSLIFGVDEKPTAANTVVEIGLGFMVYGLGF